jgi:hypothetical protein
MLRTAGDEDPEGFAQVHQLLVAAVNALPVAAELNRVQHGYSWADLARPLGISRQAAQQRLGRAEADIIDDVIDERLTPAENLRREIGQRVKLDEAGEQS